MTADNVHLVFASPRVLPKAAKLSGRVAVLDVAFVADELGTSFSGTTLKLIQDLGPRLAVWVDHHDHDRHPDFAADPRFVLAKKSEHGACPEMVSPELVARIGPVDTILCHLDLDGLYAAAKWLRGGLEPYPGADADARAVDTRIGTPSPIADRIDRALRAHFRDDDLKLAIVRYVASGAHDIELRQRIDRAAADFDDMEKETHRLAGLYQPRGRAVFVDAQVHARTAFDKTELLLAGQALAQVAVVRHAGYVTLAAAFDSGVDFLKMFGISGGMPTRVTLPEKRLGEVLARLCAIE
ncbi:MAG TPA: hypothetical protein PKL17_21425 [Pseudomonadota bacterium]|nr:hypothetical protein [Pseudomonadota bacterium]HNF99800.1 hypothetical protein [Pseudomonadota bacterium]HNI61403.1 hypothetical protein [Pseudomonadota bacterium]HNK47359.1 hypothetical protein [Pseudomonadota bacterium]HNN52680.1 hypothetical protein [Pseudomonadota bacterium]